jgi:acyl-CoA synthetase (AMP-forming)/AMP-acid ligase II
VNVGAFLRASAARHPRRTAVAYGERSPTYAELNGRVDALARSLTELGLATGGGVAIPTGSGAEAVTAVVGVTGLTEQEIVAFCREHLAGFKRPKQVWVAAETPRNSYGKVLKRELRTAYSFSPENTGPYS